MTSIFRMFAAMAAMSVTSFHNHFDIGKGMPLSAGPDMAPDVGYIAPGWTGNTQGSHRDVDHARHINRLQRKARRQERLHRKH